MRRYILAVVAALGIVAGVATAVTPVAPALASAQHATVQHTTVQHATGQASPDGWAWN